MTKPFMVDMLFYGPRSSEYVLSLRSNEHDAPSPSRRIVFGETVRVWRKGGGTIHRRGGPALEYSNGRKFWFVHGKNISGEVPPWTGGYIGFWGGGGRQMASMDFVGRFPMDMESVTVGDKP